MLNPIFCLKIDCIDFFILFWAEWKNLTTLCWTEQFVFVKFEIKLPDSRHLFNRFMYLYFIINVLYSLFGICKMYRGDGMKLARANGFLMKCIWLWQTQRSICWKCYFLYFDVLLFEKSLFDEVIEPLFQRSDLFGVAIQTAFWQSELWCSDSPLLSIVNLFL